MPKLLLLNLMMNDQEIVFNYLRKLKIPYDLIEHPPAPTIAEAMKYWSGVEASHCKNLFFRNHKGNQHYLVVFDAQQQLAIRDLEQRLKQGKLSFASEQRMAKYLSILPGSVSPFGLINDSQNHVHLFIDARLQTSNKISFHPNNNTASMILRFADFMKYLNLVGNSYEFIELYD